MYAFSECNIKQTNEQQPNRNKQLKKKTLLFPFPGSSFYCIGYLYKFIALEIICDTMSVGDKESWFQVLLLFNPLKPQENYLIIKIFIHLWNSNNKFHFWGKLETLEEHEYIVGKYLELLVSLLIHLFVFGPPWKVSVLVLLPLKVVQQIPYQLGKLEESRCLFISLFVFFQQRAFSFQAALFFGGLANTGQTLEHWKPAGCHLNILLYGDSLD